MLRGSKFAWRRGVLRLPASALQRDPHLRDTMTTRLEGPLKRELELGGSLYTLTLTPEGLLLVPKGRRKGVELRWEALVSGDAALATALNASLRQLPANAPPGPGSGKPRRA